MAPSPARSRAGTSPLALTQSGLAAGSHMYVVSGSGYKGSVGFTLTATAPSPDVKRGPFGPLFSSSA